jgi:hypothetical protein
MKREFILLLIFMMAKYCYAQGNLVPNPSFEIHDTCPTGIGQIHLAGPWTCYQSVDYLDSCGSTNFAVPGNGFGYQLAHSGKAYCQLVTFTHPNCGDCNYREFIQVQLTDTLEANETYCIQFFASPSETYSQYFSPEIGVKFSVSPIIPIVVLGSGFALPYSADFENPPTNVIQDTLGWTLISGEYTAQGGETWITIGNFKYDSSSTYSYFHNVSTYFTGLYLDDISVKKKIGIDLPEDSTVCLGDSLRIGVAADYEVAYRWTPTLGLSDTTIANPWATPLTTTTYFLMMSDTGDNYCLRSSIDSITVSVNNCTPAVPLGIPTLLTNDQTFFITSLPENSSLTLYDSRGRLLYREENYQNEFSVINLNAGMYFYQLTLPDQTVQNGKFCVVK